MRERWTKVLVAGISGALLAGLVWAIRPVEAQDSETRNTKNAAGQAASDRRDEGDTLILIHPTGDRATSSLMVEAMAPAEVPVGKSYEYTIRVTNLTDNLILENVEIQQTESQALTIEDAQIQGGQAEAKRAGESQKSRQKGQPEQPEQQKKAEQQQQQQGQHQQQGQRRDGQNQGQGTGPWTIDQLGPGESRTIRVTAVGEQEGLARNCIKVRYEPALCIATRFVQPEISLGKSAPEEANICRPLELRYLIRNGGTGVAEGITIRDELPEGLKTSEGENVVTFEVGDLEGGQEREFRTTVIACQTGTFSSRAVAEGEEVNARSNRPETTVIATDLAVNLEGPTTQYVGQPLTYRATVTNDGEAPAIGTQLTVNVADNSRVLRMSRSEPGNAEPEQSGRALTWNLGDLEPGAQRTISFTVTGRQQGEMEHEAIATTTCEVAEACEEVKSMTTVTQTVTTNLLTLPALVLEMVDESDPVKVGEETAYTIVVRNQGTGPDQNVQITANLPENLEFLEARGTTEVQAEGKTLTFQPIKTLGPNEKAQWTVRVKANSEGDVRNQIELTSEYLDQPVSEYEPTRVIPGS